MTFWGEQEQNCINWVTKEERRMGNLRLFARELHKGQQNGVELKLGRGVGGKNLTKGELLSRRKTLQYSLCISERGLEITAERLGLGEKGGTGNSIGRKVTEKLRT